MHLSSPWRGRRANAVGPLRDVSKGLAARWAEAWNGSVEQTVGLARRQAGVLVLAVLAVAVAAVTLARGGSDRAAPGRKSDPAWCTPGTQRTALCPNSKVFDAKEYAVHGNSFECINFASQADAQAVLRANPSDPNHLDDGGGVACRGLPAPRDITPVTGTAQHHVRSR